MVRASGFQPDDLGSIPSRRIILAEELSQSL